MDRRTEEAIRRVIDSIHQDLGARITIDDMARTAMFSKFHFTRVFQQVTGVSPGRFLSAVRIQEAKRLLLSTSLSVTEICFQVGYASVGTFSSRFKSSVGMSPTAYRELRGCTSRIPLDSRRHGTRTATVQGEISLPPSSAPGPVFVGLFPDIIPQGSPVRCDVLQRPGPFTLERVPQGTWYLLAQFVASGFEDDISDRSPIVGAYGPFSALPGAIIKSADVRLRPMRITDPPVLLALLDVRRVALSATTRQAC